jgi:hypothetical protein
MQHDIAARQSVFAALDAQRTQCELNARPVVKQTPGERAAELIARMDVAKLHHDKAAFLAAQNELKTLVELLPA